MQKKGNTTTYSDAQRQVEFENCAEAQEAIRAEAYEKARAHFEALSLDGNLMAKVDLARLHLRGLIAPSNPDNAVALLTEAATAGMPDASSDLGELYEAGTLIPKSSTKAFEFYRLATDQGDAHGSFNLGRCFLHARGTTQHTANAMIWLGAAAHKDHVLACYWMGSLYSTGEYIDRDLSMASNFYEHGASLGDNYSRNKLGVIYRDGTGRAVDLEQAFALFYLSAQSGNEWGQCLLGQMYKEGTHVERDWEAAARLFTLSAKQGLADAQVELGSMYGQGLGVSADRGKAIELYKAAAQQDSALANCNLGVIYITGNGITQSIDTGVKYMKRAAQLGMPDAADILEALKQKYGIESDDIH